MQLEQSTNDQSENRKNLQMTLNQLNQALSTTDPVDSEKRDRLKKLVIEVENLLNRQDVRSNEFQPLGERLKNEIAGLEAAHPNVTILVGQAADMLSKMGI